MSVYLAVFVLIRHLLRQGRKKNQQINIGSCVCVGAFFSKLSQSRDKMSIPLFCVWRIAFLASTNKEAKRMRINEAMFEQMWNFK